MSEVGHDFDEESRITELEFSCVPCTDIIENNPKLKELVEKYLETAKDEAIIKALGGLNNDK